jgi:hypothetical protein
MHNVWYVNYYTTENSYVNFKTFCVILNGLKIRDIMKEKAFNERLDFSKRMNAE